MVCSQFFLLHRPNFSTYSLNNNSLESFIGRNLQPVTFCSQLGAKVSQIGKVRSRIGGPNSPMVFGRPDLFG